MARPDGEDLEDMVAYYTAWKEHWAAPRPLADEHDPYRCPICNAKMLRDPWRCPEHGPVKPRFRHSYQSRLSRHIDREAEEWSTPDWEGLVDGLLARLGLGKAP